MGAPGQEGNERRGMETGKKVILASASPRRQELLARIGIEFEVRKSHAEEENSPLALPKEPSGLVRELARLKAADIWGQLSEEERKNALVIGADTVVSLEGRVLGKPEDQQDAVRMLSLLQGRTHQVYTGAALLYERGGQYRENCFFEKTEVEVFPMQKEEIAAYAATGEPMDKAGAYGIQGSFAAYIKGISGDYNNVVGLPVGRLYQEMKKI